MRRIWIGVGILLGLLVLGILVMQITDRRLGTVSDTLKQAAQMCGGYVEEQYKDVTFLGANMDSRKILPGQLFVALEGVRDGHDFIPNAMEKGAAAVLCTRKVGDYPAIYVQDPRKALGDIAREELKRIKELQCVLFRKCTGLPEKIDLPYVQVIVE